MRQLERPQFGQRAAIEIVKVALFPKHAFGAIEGGPQDEVVDADPGPACVGFLRLTLSEFPQHEGSSRHQHAGGRSTPNQQAT
jgi:hypothetical protein